MQRLIYMIGFAIVYVVCLILYIRMFIENYQIDKEKFKEDKRYIFYATILFAVVVMFFIVFGVIMGGVFYGN